MTTTRTLPAQDDRENARRAEYMFRLMLIYRQWRSDDAEDDDTVVADLLADLMHYCDEYAVDWDNAIRRASLYHADELAEPCAGCFADAGEPCRPDCLSAVTDRTGQPVGE